MIYCHYILIKYSERNWVLKAAFLFYFLLLHDKNVFNRKEQNTISAKQFRYSSTQEYKKKIHISRALRDVPGFSLLENPQIYFKPYCRRR